MFDRVLERHLMWKNIKESLSDILLKLVSKCSTYLYCKNFKPNVYGTRKKQPPSTTSTLQKFHFTYDKLKQLWKWIQRSVVTVGFSINVHSKKSIYIGNDELTANLGHFLKLIQIGRSKLTYLVYLIWS